MLTSTQVKPKIDFMLSCGDHPSVLLKVEMATFLHEVEKRGSLNAASKTLHVSYPRALSKLTQLERALGTSLVERVRPDGSRLTRDGRSLLEMFEQSQLSMERYAVEMVQIAWEEGGSNIPKKE